MANGGDFTAADPTNAPAVDLSAPGGWARGVLRKLGAPDDPNTLPGQRNISFLEGWAKAEGTSARYNPLATTLSVKGSTDFNSAGVQNYASPADGIGAIAATIKAGYPYILSALRQGQPQNALSSSGGLSDLNKWVSGSRNPNPSAYTANVAGGYYGTKSASDWTSWDLTDAAGAAASAAGKIPGVSSIASIATAIGKVSGALLDQNTWRRIGLAVLGLVLMVAGGFLLSRQAAGPVAAVAGAV